MRRLTVTEEQSNWVRYGIMQCQSKYQVRKEIRLWYSPGFVYLQTSGFLGFLFA